MEFQYIPASPRIWEGRYKIPKGEESAYHVNSRGEINIRWRDKSSEYKYNCPISDSEAVRHLAKAINTLKRRETGRAGGSFVINEFGQVICPVVNSTKRFSLGEVSGPLYFEDPWDDAYLLSLDVNDLKCGVEWELPYIGIQYQLHSGDHIYFWKETPDGGYKAEPPRQDDGLIDKLREIREYGSARFIVNQHGIVLTKKPYSRNK